MGITAIIFWLSLFLIFWTYLGYFVTLWAISLLHPRQKKIEDYLPGLSLIITVHNEEKRIMEKLKNTLMLEYPAEKIEVIVVSDGSSDCTNDIVKSYEPKGIKLLPIEMRHGKHYCQGKGIAQAKNEIIILTDATTFLRPDALRKIARNFAEPEIGCVSGIDEIKSGNGESGEGAYVRYEMKLRLLESETGSLVSASGSFYAIRKKLCSSWYPNMSADFYLPIISYKKGYRSILDTEAVGYYEIIDNHRKEFQRKVRTVVHGLDVLFHFRSIVNPFRYGFYSLQLISHKLIRWMVPLCLSALFISNALLLHSGRFYQIFLFCQILFYAAATIPLVIRGLRPLKIFKIPFFFAMANLSILVAWVKYLIGERYVTWESTKR